LAGANKISAPSCFSPHKDINFIAIEFIASRRHDLLHSSRLLLYRHNFSRLEHKVIAVGSGQVVGIFAIASKIRDLTAAFST
jgi:hypothetical protein